MAKKFDLFSKNYKQLNHVATAAYSAGDFVQLEDVKGFTLVDVAIGDNFALVTAADMAKAEKESGVAIAAGDAVYYNTTNNNVTNVATGAVLIGHAQKVAASADTEIIIEFDGFASFLKA